ncbi:hypothetical protein MNEG_7836 [Monoraphidium neglectum]|uniref:Uncharacterized protein n=1 Tax=Monoraphidium neglectum TaxID=145388 RepID=A0A0D2KY18_9CHLO|nr:hypothetical protein MNEG_7836 [Monoraphidium neglectum]KIZ00129.1 hypothetical protein MNEG_7836 [Monoraphidium neglectum]|eukprot:XP_013899148.1 hypothetical protein MNEG_7836 [Monoraphidium neglectum]
MQTQIVLSLDVQLNTDLIAKQASCQAVNGNFLCNLAAALDQDIKAGDSSITSGAYAA